MPKKPKEQCSESDEPVENPEKDTWTEDQKRRSYYYDDAHGYEKYIEEDDNDDEENGE
jgi:hypothetical protein